jgi:hypothetical protein
VIDFVRGRMLLSHNFNLSTEILPHLSREEFAAVFREGLGERAYCRLVDNPHWIVEVLFDRDRFSPPQMGEYYGRALAEKRLTQIRAGTQLPQILVLGGTKTTPATSDSPDALQLGDWGVDIVETLDAEQFLLDLNWEANIALKSPETVFKFVLPCN